MPDLFQDGQEASRAKVMGQFAELQAKGQTVLDAIDRTRRDTLLRFENGLSALNSLRQIANRILSSDIACRFVTSDLLDIDQGSTSATLRADSQSATLRERSRSSETYVESISFSSSAGQVESFYDMHRVLTENNEKPVGRFDVKLLNQYTISLLVFDIVTLPGDPQIRVFASKDGVTYVESSEVSRNGYRVNAWFGTQTVRYIRIEMTPSHPDNPGGSSFTFGVDSLHADIVDFHLYSELMTRFISFAPASAKVKFKAPSDPGLTYFLQLGDAPMRQVAPDEVLSIPGASLYTVENCQISADYIMCETVDNVLQAIAVPGNIYPSTLRVFNLTDNVYRRIAYGYTPGAESLADQYIAVHGNVMEICPKEENTFVTEAGKTHRISWVRGPAAVQARLKVQILSSDRSVTPVFTGAYLETVID